MSEAQSVQLPDAGSLTTQTASNVWRGLLESNLGRRVAAELLIGMDTLVEKAGELYAVQSDYFVLRDDYGNYVACDLFSLKFVSFCPGCETSEGNANADSAETSAVGVRAAAAVRTTSAAALNYAKRKARRLD